MLPIERVPASLHDMLHAARRIVHYAKGLDQATYINTEATRLIIERLLTILGEAAGQVPEEYCSQHPELPWRDMVRLRNLLMHQYFRTNEARVFDIVMNQAPKLIPLLEDMLRQFPSPQ
jgi:uncharacterized protein with HEPN domain